jgi:tellurite resistance protein TerC
MIFDLGVLGRKDHAIGFKESLLLSFFYFSIACIFGLYVHHSLGSDPAREYYAGFFIEKAMAIDNIFVISMVFRFFAIPPIYQRRVLLWGIIGVVFLRALMIAGGAYLIDKFSWVLYIFAVILFITGIKLIYLQDKQLNIRELKIYKLMQRYLNIADEIKDHRFFIIKNGKLYATVLFVALVIIEGMDVIFAFDSIPAIFAITDNVYIVYTSNIFAILGLRALYFCLNDIVERFVYLKYSLALILIFISVKIFMKNTFHISTTLSLGITVGLLIAGVVVSLLNKKTDSSSPEGRI